MSLHLAAIEHHARRLWAAVEHALFDQARAFSNREDGDFLDDVLTRAEAIDAEYARQDLVKREAEEETWQPHERNGDCCTFHQVAYFDADDDADRLDCLVNPPRTPAAGVTADPAPAALTAGEWRDLLLRGAFIGPEMRPNFANIADWATPAICDVLAEHYIERPTGMCRCGDCDTFDLGGWREHVAPLIAERLETARFSAEVDQ